MNGRLIVAVITTLLDEVALVALLLWGLPRLGISIPIPALIAILILWGYFMVVLYIAGSKILRKQPIIGFTNMQGCRGKVVRTIAPEGMVKIKGELWSAKSTGEPIHCGEKVIVVGQDSLLLIVQKIPKG